MTIRLFFTGDPEAMGAVPVNHRLLACSVAVMWGLNFIAIHASLEHFPPLFLAALRFALIAVPPVLLVPRPAVELRWLIGYRSEDGLVGKACVSPCRSRWSAST